MRKLTVVFTLAILVTPLIATAQEDDIAKYATLDQLAHVIDAFVAGEDVEGVIFDAAEEASDVIVRQFQITTNLVSGPTRGKEGIEFIPVGFSEGSATELDNLEKQFDGTIGEFGGIIPPLAPGSRVDDEIDVSALFEAWTAYGDRGPIEGPVIINPSVQTIWGLELSEPIEGNCDERRYFGRTWVSEGVGGAPDPLFTAEGLADSYNNDSHEALAGSGGRLIEFFCTNQGSVAWAQRMKDDGSIRPFGPTGVIALVKDQYVVFFNRVGELDGRLDQFFYASPVMVARWLFPRWNPRICFWCPTPTRRTQPESRSSSGLTEMPRATALPDNSSITERRPPHSRSRQVATAAPPTPSFSRVMTSSVQLSRVALVAIRHQGSLDDCWMMS